MRGALILAWLAALVWAISAPHHWTLAALAMLGLVYIIRDIGRRA